MDRIEEVMGALNRRGSDQKLDLQGLETLIKELFTDHLGAWMSFSFKGMPVTFTSLEHFCESWIGITRKELERLLPVVVWPKAAKHGGDRVSEEQGTNSTLVARLRGTTAVYTYRRLKREFPHLAVKVDEGELSITAAAIEAGFRKSTGTVVLTDAASAARTLAKHYSLAELVEAWPKEKGPHD